MVAIGGGGCVYHCSRSSLQEDLFLDGLAALTKQL